MAGGRNSTPGLAEVVAKFGRQLMEQHALSARQIKALHNIVECRTARMGGHEQVCDQCGEVSYRYNSCGDRHCPKCQITKQAVWINDLVEATLPVKHYHIIFTVPHQLNDICLYDPKAYYQVLFSAVWRTLHSFGYSHYGAETGAIAILHSWGIAFGDRICLYILISIASFPQLGIPLMDSGSISARIITFCTRYINSAVHSKESSLTVSIGSLRK
jgi:PIN domain nuclease of toxin-antitoxin system